MISFPFICSVAFRTTPMDSTGVPHILEHTVLCGSRKFPVRDPFFKMLNRSLATFMNALTGTVLLILLITSSNIIPNFTQGDSAFFLTERLHI